jgi:transcriptional regulator with XRE-family HTH domain
MNGLRYFKHMTGITNRQLAKDMGISLLLANFWTSGHESISDNHKKEMEQVYGIPFYLLKKEMNPTTRLKMDIAMLKALGKIESEKDIVLNETIFFNSFTALGYALFAKDMTQKELSESMGVSISTVQSFLKKDGKVSKKYRDSLAKVMNLPIDLLEGKLFIDTKWAIDSLLAKDSERVSFVEEVEELA